MNAIAATIAEQLAVGVRQVEAAVRLLDEGATVPFVARYRKEATGGLDDTQLRTLEKRLASLRDLGDRRATILKSLAEQDVLTPALQAAVAAADTPTRLEDLYRPFRPKRRTKAQVARAAGLAPLAARLLANPELNPEQAAAAFVDAERGVPDVESALDGARQVLIEDFADDAELVGRLREHLWERADLAARVVRGKEQEGVKFSDYFDASEALRRVPSHRALAMFRGREEAVLRLALVLREDAELAATAPTACERMIAAHFRIRARGRAADAWLAETVRAAWRGKLAAHLETDLLSRLRERAESEAIAVFANNLRDLLLAAPAGRRLTMGLDPGLRTGVKVAVVYATGKLVATATIYPHAPRNDWDAAIGTLARLAAEHAVELVSIGNGTASRETDRLAADLAKRHPQLRLTKVMVSEAGASVYSASELGAAEFPDLDVSLRGAVSIARRLQDPLAELVKIDAKAIGVGQYQHDVDQAELARALDAVVEDAVNAVGVDLNTASAALLQRVSGLGPVLAANVVRHRDAHGAFRNRRQLLAVPRLGAKAFEQAAGFLRIADGDNPLDASGVHPEAYPVVERILRQIGRDIRQVIGDTALLRGLRADDFVDDRFGAPTVRDILAELEKPGRDPRPQFRTASFREGIERLEQLQPGMQLEGVVTNVTNFGAFVDVGVHQDGLVHISALADHFVRDPRAVVKAGDVVSVRVVEVDLARRRIALSMRRPA
ncbi:MAG TPA: Tex family protein [Candidatus Dormibacteraeota bacterium]|nr:Tex family protein [Candidatus Dormibacteraeota bacterium]